MENLKHTSEEVRDTFTVPESNLDGLLEAIAKLNKRAKRIGVPAIEVSSEHSHCTLEIRPKHGDVFWLHEDNTEAFMARTPNGELTGRSKPWLTVTIKGEAPRYNGWTFAAALEPVAEIGPDGKEGTVNLVSSVPGAEKIPHEFRSRIGECDHCSKSRRRKHTYVVHHAEEGFKIVGKTCLKDFLGHKDPRALASWAELLIELHAIGEGSEGEGYFGGGASAPSWEPEFYLGWALSVIAKKGWTSKGVAADREGMMATATLIDYLLDPPRFTGRNATRDRHEWEELKEECAPNDDYRKRAAEVLKWARSIDEVTVERNDYLANVRTVARMPAITRKRSGIAASIPVAHAKATDSELEAKKRAKRAALSLIHI
jgi:hypothetical protein